MSPTCLAEPDKEDAFEPYMYGEGDMYQPGLSVFYRDILRKQYIASFGNIRKYRDTRGYHDIFTIFFYA